MAEEIKKTRQEYLFERLLKAVSEGLELRLISLDYLEEEIIAELEQVIIERRKELEINGRTTG